MLKRLSLLAVAVSALAAISAPASALATSISANAEPGEMYTAKSTNLVTTMPATKLECATVTIEGTLGEDTSEVTTIGGTSPTAKFAGGAGMGDDCATSTPGVTAMISATVSNLSFKATTAGLTTESLWVYTDPNTNIVAICRYHAVLSLNYNHNEAVEGTVAGENQLTQLAEGTCPSAKGSKATMSGSFAVTKGTGGEGEALEITTP